MAANAWLSVIAKKGAVVVYPRTICCQQWNDTFGMVFFSFFSRPADPNFSLKNPSNNFSNRYGLSIPDPYSMRRGGRCQTNHLSGWLKC